MFISPSITPIGLSSLANISPASFQFLTEGTSLSASLVLDGGADQIALSGTGQLLSTISSYQNRLEALQASAADTSPSAALVTAQTLVVTFNELQGSLGTVQTLFETLTGSSLVDQLVQSLNELAATSIAAIRSSLDKLSDIGIRIQITPSSDITATSIALSIDQNVLNAAVTADATGTQAILAEVIQSLIGLTTGFETQIAEAAASLPDLTPLGTQESGTGPVIPGISVSTDLLPDVLARTVLNNVLEEELVDVLLSRNIADVAPPVTAEGNLLATLLATSTTEVATPLNVTTTQTTDTTSGSAVAATPVLPDRTLPTGVTVIAEALPATTTTTVAAVAATQGNPDLAASQAALELQRLLADPAAHATRNLFDPAYAGLIAASHLGDFVSPDQAANLKALAADFPAPISPIAPSHGIAYYGEASGDSSKRLAAYVDNRI
jgi:hypothetical protein